MGGWLETAPVGTGRGAVSHRSRFGTPSGVPAPSYQENGGLPEAAHQLQSSSKAAPFRGEALGPAPPSLSAQLPTGCGRYSDSLLLEGTPAGAHRTASRHTPPPPPPAQGRREALRPPTPGHGWTVGPLSGSRPSSLGSGWFSRALSQHPSPASAGAPGGVRRGSRPAQGGC